MMMDTCMVICVCEWAPNSKMEQNRLESLYCRIFIGNIKAACCQSTKIYIVYFNALESSESSKSLGTQEQNRIFGIESACSKPQVDPTLYNGAKKKLDASTFVR